MLPVNVTSLKNASPLAVTPLTRAASECVCHPGALFFQFVMRLSRCCPSGLSCLLRFNRPQSS